MNDVMLWTTVAILAGYVLTAAALLGGLLWIDWRVRRRRNRRIGWYT